MQRTLLSQVVEEIQAAIGTTDVNIRHFVSGAEGVEETAEDADITSYLIAYCNGLSKALEIVAGAVDELRRSKPDDPTTSE